MNSSDISVVLLNKNSKIPKKAHYDDVGYDLEAIQLEKVYENGCHLFNTGIIVKPPKGYYLEIIPRSSIIKHGWVLANNTGIIDPSYRGELKIALQKINENATELKTPFTLCQLVLRKLYESSILQVENLDETVRGEGGFGSTDK